ncbi:hypothetical protein MPTK1_5g11940 [Marchantia polymorpha subsp. ruderalis]|uniref:Uncharacterized protein n=2 Tax=Marchantia polymorpha TaxID=3197 RepID=A0AAF6BHG0_MARPO|nr:hypothetical protein MARPO_0143s0023 [Marchantia polymorpha]BBN11444.1 hypothetical protein Mp_5g11940 [Marchantia polymorpha subsp. ruderalis]|eukprot:PTQ29343.1 hypothetical protein MARPO_0143s0023 [Marchantia polymorpha]
MQGMEPFGGVTLRRSTVRLHQARVRMKGWSSSCRSLISAFCDQIDHKILQVHISGIVCINANYLKRWNNTTALMMMTAPESENPKSSLCTLKQVELREFGNLGAALFATSQLLWSFSNINLIDFGVNDHLLIVIPVYRIPWK